MRPPQLILMLTTVTLAIAIAQPSYQRVLTPADFEAGKPVLLIDPTQHTVVHFQKQIGFVFTKNPEILKASVDKSTLTEIYLYAVREAPDPGLTIRAGNDLFNFSIKFVRNIGVQEFDVRDAPPVTSTPAKPSPTNASPTPFTPTSAAKPSAAALPTAPAVAAPNALPKPGIDLTTELHLSLSRIASDASLQRLAYVLENFGNRKLYMTPENLSVSRDGAALPHESQFDGRLILAPGASLTGTIAVKATPGSLTVRWIVREFGDGAPLGALEETL